MDRSAVSSVRLTWLEATVANMPRQLLTSIPDSRLDLGVGQESMRMKLPTNLGSLCQAVNQEQHASGSVVFARKTLMKTLSSWQEFKSAPCASSQLTENNTGTAFKLGGSEDYRQSI